MDRIGVSFKSTLSPDEVREAYIRPLRRAVEDARAGVYSNYLHQADADPAQPAEHLLVFVVRDFEQGLRLIRMEMENLPRAEGLAFHNLNPSDPAY